MTDATTQQTTGWLAAAKAKFEDLPKPSPHAVGLAVLIAATCGLIYWAALPDTRLERQAAALKWTAEDGPPARRQISYSEGSAVLKNHGAVRVTEHLSDVTPTRVFDLEMKSGARRWFRAALTAKLEEVLSDSGADIKIVVDDDTLTMIGEALSLGSSMLVIVVFGFFVINGARKFFSNPARIVRAGKNAVRFKDVEGQPEAVAAMREVIAVMKQPERYGAMGARVPAGILMCGPPGNGKTLIAKATAAEAGVPFLATSGSAFLEMFAGLGARRVRSMFRTARRLARHSGGVILFVDEFDVVAGIRGLGNGSDVAGERDQTTTALLTELDGIEKRRGVVLLVATNRPELIDPAVTRPGRIDRRVEVTPPDAAARGRILAVHCQALKLADDVDPAAIGRSMPGASGADLANLANMAALRAVKRNLSAVDSECFEDARDEILMGEARTAADTHPDEMRLAAFHEAGHALLMVLQEECDPVYKASVVPRKASLGQVVSVAARDWRTMNRAKIAALLTVMVAGRAAEADVAGEDAVTTGAAQDIVMATRLARDAIGRYGMHGQLGMMDYIGDGVGAAPASPEAMASLDRAVAETIEACRANAQATIERHRAAHRALAEALETKGTLSGDEVRTVIHAVAGPDAAAVRVAAPWGARKQAEAKAAA